MSKETKSITIHKPSDSQTVEQYVFYEDFLQVTFHNTETSTTDMAIFYTAIPKLLEKEPTVTSGTSIGDKRRCSACQEHTDYVIMPSEDTPIFPIHPPLS